MLLESIPTTEANRAQSTSAGPCRGTVITCTWSGGMCRDHIWRMASVS